MHRLPIVKHTPLGTLYPERTTSCCSCLGSKPASGYSLQRDIRLKVDTSFPVTRSNCQCSMHHLFSMACILVALQEVEGKNYNRCLVTSTTLHCICLRESLLNSLLYNLLEQIPSLQHAWVFITHSENFRPFQFDSLFLITLSCRMQVRRNELSFSHN